MKPAPSTVNGRDFGSALHQALVRRHEFIRGRDSEGFRVFSGVADGIDGVYIDVYGPGAVIMVYEGGGRVPFDATAGAPLVLEVLKPEGVRAVYLKRFARDRSRLGGELPATVTDGIPAAGEILPEAIRVREVDWTLEVRLYDGLSTGLFLDQRENRRSLSRWIAGRAKKINAAPTVLNTFAYTCAFSIAAAIGGAATTSVDVSARYLEWGKRNFAHNGIDAGLHRFARMDTFEFFAYARRKGLRYDLVVLDPPSFGSGSKAKRIRPWSAVSDYARLVREGVGLLKPRGMIFASTNTRELCLPGRLEAEIRKGLGARPAWVKLPNAPLDFASERERLAARAFEV